MLRHARVAHHVRGRIRVKLPSARGNAELLKQVADSLAAAEGIRSIECNINTGSLVVHYDERNSTDFPEVLAAHGRNCGLFSLAPPEVSEVDRMAEAIEREAEYLAEHSEAARALVESVKVLNNQLRRATHNNLDLKVLLPLGLAAWAVIDHDPELATPLWLTLSIFSFNSFLSLHSPPPGVTARTQQVIRENAAGSVEHRITTITPDRQT
jgi:hypothetical protein